MSNHITLNRINDKTKFFSEFRSRMSIIEGNDKFVYFDGAGNATTGIGFNLRDKGVVDILIATLAKKYETPTTTDNNGNITHYNGIEVDDLNFSSHIIATKNVNEQINIKDNIKTYWNDVRVKLSPYYNKDTEDAKEAVENIKKEPFDLSKIDDNFINDVFDKIASNKLKELNDNLVGKDANGKDKDYNLFKGDNYSYERLALLSLRYNSVTGTRDVIGENLKNALAEGDRFRAWFEIRYNSNSSHNGINQDGIQKRRYYEAEMFGLFDVKNEPSSREIRHILDTLGKRVPGNNSKLTYAQKISEVEREFEAQIKSAKEDVVFNTLPGVTDLKYVSEVFKPLANEILQRYLPEHLKGIIKTSDINGQVLPGITDKDGNIAIRDYPERKEGNKTISPVKDDTKTNLLIAIAEEQIDNSGNVIKGKDGNSTFAHKENHFIGGADNDIMIGGDHTDVMDAGNGKNIMIGGGGNDTLNGGDDDDELIGGKGKDILKGGKGKDRYTFVDIDDIDEDIIEDPDGGQLKIGHREMPFNNLKFKGGDEWEFDKYKCRLIKTGESENGNFIADLQISVQERTKTKIFTIKNWKYSAIPGADFDNSGTADDTSFELLSGTFGITLKRPTGFATAYRLEGDQVAPFKSDGKTYNWEATQWNYENGRLIGGKKEAGFNDVLRGTEGRDYIRGFGGNDAIEGGAGRDVLEGGEGGDLLVGGYGSDYLYGGNGNDVLFATGRLETDLKRIRAGETASSSMNGLPLFTDGSVWGAYGYKVVGVISGLDTDSDSVHKTDETNTRGDTLVGGQGKDTQVGSQENDTLYGDEQSPASQEDKSQGDIDTIYGKGGNDVIYGGPGDDVLCGDGDTNDVGTSNSYFTKMPDDARPGNDIIHGNAGNDTIFGCEGNDIVHGDEDDDILRGNDGNDYLDGGEGNDTVWGDNGDDMLHGGDGDDWLSGDHARIDDLGTKTGNDIIYGGAGKDTLLGGYGNDQLHGGDNNDHLFPGPGNDYMTGGTGNDVFHIYREGMEHKVISDFGDWDVIFLRDTRLDDYMLSQSGNDLLMTLKSGEGQLLVKNYFSLAPDAPSSIAEMGGQSLLQPQEIFNRIKAQAPQSGEEQPQDENADSAIADNAAQPQAEDAAADQEHHAQPEPPTAALQESVPPQPLMSAEGNPFAAASPVMEPLLNLDHAHAGNRDAHSPAADMTPSLTLRDEMQLPQWGDLLADTGEHATLVAPLTAHAPLHEQHDDEHHAPADAALRHVPLADSTQHLLDHWQHQSGLL